MDDWIKAMNRQAREYFHRRLDGVAANVDLRARSPAGATDTYELPRALIEDYFRDLLIPDSTKRQWQLGRELHRQYVGHHYREYSLGSIGRPRQHADRIFMLFHVEWCIQVLEMGETQAVAATAEFFNERHATIARWLKERKGKFAAERKAATDLFAQLSADPA